MDTRDSRSIAAPSGLRTPSPIKSRLPVGSSLPQRSTSIKGLSHINLQPTVRKPSVRASGTGRRSTLVQSSLQSGSARVENQRPNRPEKTTVNSSTDLSNKHHQSGILQKSTVSAVNQPVSTHIQPLVYSRSTLDDRLELVHLHAIYSKASEAQGQWESHAFQVYQKQFQALQNRNRELDHLEIDQLTQRNASAIISWPEPGRCLSQKVHTLSKVICDVEQLTSTNGKYSLALQAFEHWIATVTVLQDQHIKTRIKAKPETIEGLGDGWLKEIEALQWQVVTLADKMLELQVLEPNGSDLERVITTVSEMLKNMLEELEMMVELESSSREDEQDQFDGSVAVLTDELSKGLRLK